MDQNLPPRPLYTKSPTVQLIVVGVVEVEEECFSKGP